MQRQQIGNMIDAALFLGMVSGNTVPRIETIEDFVERYPWCAIGHKSLFTALCRQSEEAWLSYVSKASAYLFNRKTLYDLAHTRSVLPDTAEPFLEEILEKSKIPERKVLEEIEIIPDPVERIVMVGGDYFAQTELDASLLEEQNPIDKFIKINPKLTPVQNVQQTKEEKEEKVSLMNAGEDNFMTETLAKIYADQSLYQLAIESYEKLILLYPKKSDYFASRIQELKSKMNR